MPTYYLSLYHAPSVVIQTLEKLIRNFFLEGEGMEDMHNVNLETTQCARLMGDLGIGNLRACNRSLLAKWACWFLHESTALWRRLIVAKYYSNTCIWPSTIQGSSRSPLLGAWRFICHTIYGGQSHPTSSWQWFVHLFLEGPLAQLWYSILFFPLPFLFGLLFGY